MRQIVLDTETTGLDPKSGHRIIEIGCIELINRRITKRSYHQYINPQREIDEGAIKIHGLTMDFLADKPLFSDIVDDFMAFIDDAELIIHNAPFDVGFIDAELEVLKHKKWRKIDKHCSVFDTLDYARKLHAGQKNSLDALCKRYSIDATKRTLHGALLDAQILANVYLAMTGGQTALEFVTGSGAGKRRVNKQMSYSGVKRAGKIPVVYANSEELALHEAYLERLGGRECTKTY